MQSEFDKRVCLVSVCVESVIARNAEDGIKWCFWERETERREQQQLEMLKLQSGPQKETREALD